jgi:hypothetical protein
MGWLRDRLARLGVRGPSGRDAVAAVLAVPGLARIPVTLLVNGGRRPVPAWQLSVSPSTVKIHVGSLLASSAAATGFRRWSTPTSTAS